MNNQMNENISDQKTFRRLLSYTKPHRKKLIVVFGILFVATVADVLGPILIKIFIDDYLTPKVFDIRSIVMLAVGYILLIIIAAVLNYIQLISFQKIALNIIHQLRIEVFEKVQNLSLSFFDKTPGGSLISRITNDTEAIKELYVSIIAAFAQNVVYIAGVLIAMFFLNVKLAIFFLLLMPIIIALIKVYRTLSSKVYHLSRKKLSQLNTKLNESLQGMNVIQAMRQEKRFRKEFGTINDEHYNANLKQIKINSLLSRAAVDLIYLLALMIILSFFGISSLNNPIEIGIIYAFINYLDRFFEPINTIMARLGLFQQAIVSAERVFGLLDENKLAPNKVGINNPKIEKGLIEFKNVTFSYDGKTNVLNNISFTAKPGETVALVGHTGSGKSSIINLLMRFYPFSQGKILIDGVELQEFSNDELRKKVGLVLQDPFLFSGDINYNIRLHNKNITDQEIVEASNFVQADSFIQETEEKYKNFVNERGTSFSSGQRQLLSFARTMAINPKILVLDEATSSIDTETEGLIQTALSRMRTGRTTIAIAHRLSTIQDADQIIVLRKGNMIEQGTHQELLQKKGVYYNMYLLQQGIKP